MIAFGRSSKLFLVGLVAAAALLLVGAASASAQFGIASFDGEVLEADGSPSDRAGAHPFTASTGFTINTVEGEFGRQPDGNIREVEVDLPVGFAGDPTAVPKCTAAEFYPGVHQVTMPQCPAGSQVGFVEFSATWQGTRKVPLFNMVPQPGLPAQFAFKAITSNIFLDVHVRPGDNGITVKAPDLSQGYAVTGTKVTLWGVPSDPAHTPDRGAYCIDYGIGTGYECFVEGGLPAGSPPRPFLTNPTSCTGPVQTHLRMRAWAGETDSASFTSHDTFGNPLGIVGCDEVPFEPSFDVSMGESAATPSGLRVEIGVPQSENPSGLASSHVKDVSVELPEGVTVNASSADGLAACTAAQIGLGTDAAVSCPDASKIGTVRVETPVLEQPLDGAVYLAQQRQNPFGSLLALYMVAEGSGVRIKLPGRVESDPRSGQLRATFADNPQLPFEKLTVQFFGGARAPLTTPAACGTYAVSAGFNSWSRPGETVQRGDSFKVDRGPGGGACPNGGFDPKLSAGTANPIAGAASPFSLRISRDDASQELGALELALPEGLLGKLAGVPYCAESALSAIPGADGTAAAQLATPACPAGSRVGTARVGAGAGSNPFYLDTGRVYLTGPYKGAPIGLAVVTPALAGPFDLGNVVVRAALRVDPATARVTAVSDPLPTVLHGIPLNLRDVRVDIDRKGFTLNPTSCNPMAVNGTIVSANGKNARVSDRFQVGSCASLGFTPRLKLSLKGPTERAKYPALRAVLNAKPGQANIGRVAVTLPKSAFLAQNHIRTICTRVQFAAKACPPGSVYGQASAVTPLLDKPLSGPVYLRSSSNELPDLVAALDGQIEIDLVGRIDSVDGGIRTTFESVPDAPVSKFTLQMRGGKKSLLVNSRDLCKSTNRAKVLVDGQNGKAADQTPVLTNSCGKKAKKRR